MGGGRAEKWGLERRGWNKLTEVTSDRQLLAVIIESGSGDESPKSGGREVFAGGRGRRDDRCVSGSAVVGGENRRQRGLRKRSRATRY